MLGLNAEEWSVLSACCREVYWLTPEEDAVAVGLQRRGLVVEGVDADGDPCFDITPLGDLALRAAAADLTLSAVRGLG